MPMSRTVKYRLISWAYCAHLDGGSPCFGKFAVAPPSRHQFSGAQASPHSSQGLDETAIAQSDSADARVVQVNRHP